MVVWFGNRPQTQLGKTWNLGKGRKVGSRDMVSTSLPLADPGCDDVTIDGDGFVLLLLLFIFCPLRSLLLTSSWKRKRKKSTYFCSKNQHFELFGLAVVTRETLDRSLPYGGFPTQIQSYQQKIVCSGKIRMLFIFFATEGVRHETWYFFRWSDSLVQECLGNFSLNGL